MSRLPGTSGRSIARILAGPLVLVGLWQAGMGALACSSDSSSTPADSGRIDCPFVRDQTNCWRTFVAKVDVCLGQGDGGTFATPGLLDDAGRTCDYAARSIVATGSQALDQPQTGTDPLQRDFTVSKDGRACLAVHQSGKTVTLVSEGTTLAYQGGDGTMQLTCADGRVLEGRASELLDCVTASGGLPGYAYRNTSKTAFFSLLGMNGPAYDCARNTDAATD